MTQELFFNVRFETKDVKYSENTASCVSPTNAVNTKITLNDYSSAFRDDS